MAGKVNAGLNENVVVKIGQTEKLVGGASIRFIEVVEDSRCPEGATCIWAGRAIVKAELTENGADPKTFELEVGNLESVFNGEKFSIKALKLDPYPKAENETQKDAYTATFLVERKARAECE